MNMETRFTVHGMTCKHCQTAVMTALKKIAGVSAVVVDLEQQEVIVTYDAKQPQITEKLLKQVVDDLGYEVP